MPQEKQKLQTELQEISNKIYELKDLIDKETNSLIVARLGKQRRELQCRALFYIEKIERM